MNGILLATDLLAGDDLAGNESRASRRDEFTRRPSKNDTYFGSQSGREDFSLLATLRAHHGRNNSSANRDVLDAAFSAEE